jgi:hypothetical protein
MTVNFIVEILKQYIQHVVVGADAVKHIKRQHRREIRSFCCM